jgi:hypothetical protein
MTNSPKKFNIVVQARKIMGEILFDHDTFFYFNFFFSGHFLKILLNFNQKIQYSQENNEENII